MLILSRLRFKRWLQKAMHSDLFCFHFLDVSMTIPQGALPEGQRSEIFLAVSRDDKDRPKLTGEYRL